MELKDPSSNHSRIFVYQLKAFGISAFIKLYHLEIQLSRVGCDVGSDRKTLDCQSKGLRIKMFHSSLFIVLACHLPVLDGFN